MEEMAVRLATAIVILALSAPAVAQDARGTLLFGIGRNSCATWLASPDSEYEGSAWLLGFWTGANYWGDMSAVGASTDALGVIESVKKLCRDDPAGSLAGAASKLYHTFRQEGR